MVADWHDGFVLRSIWVPEADGKSASYQLILKNRTKSAITGFSLGISGPVRINQAAEIKNGRIVTQLSNYA